MARRIEIDGKFYRIRRGKLVEIPAEWVGRTVAHRTIHQRPSKHSRKHRMRADRNGYTREGHPRNWPPRHTSGAERLFGDDYPL